MKEMQPVFMPEQPKRKLSGRLMEIQNFNREVDYNMNGYQVQALDNPSKETAERIATRSGRAILMYLGVIEHLGYNVEELLEKVSQQERSKQQRERR